MKHIILLILLTLGIWAEEIGVPFFPEAIHENENFSHKRFISHLQYASSKNILISGDNNGTVSFISLSPLRVIKQIHAHNSAITVMALTPDNDYLITAGEDKTLKLWDIKSYVQVGKFDIKDIPIYGAVVTHDGKTLITADICSNLSYWDMNTFEKKGEYLLEEDCLQYYKKSPATTSLMFQDMKLSHDGKQVAIANSRRISFNRYPDEDIFIIDITKNQIVSSGWIGGEVLYAGDIGFSNDDKYIIFPSMYKKNDRGEYVQDFTKSSSTYTRFNIATKEIILGIEPLSGNFISSDDEAWLLSASGNMMRMISTKFVHTTTKSLYSYAKSNIIFDHNMAIVGLNDRMIRFFSFDPHSLTLSMSATLYLFEDGDWVAMSVNGEFESSFDLHHILMMQNNTGKPILIDKTTYQKFNRKISIGEK